MEDEMTKAQMAILEAARDHALGLLAAIVIMAVSLWLSSRIAGRRDRTASELWAILPFTAGGMLAFWCTLNLIGALMNAARAEATEAQARRIGELEAGLRRVSKSEAMNPEARARDLSLSRELADRRDFAARALSPHDKEPSDDR
jgi:hypothetical protein